MKNKSFKYLVIFLIFILGIALGSISTSKSVKDEIEDFENELEENEFYIGDVKHSNEDVGNNMFVKIAKLIERVIKKMFKAALDVLGKGLKLIFGI